jgi:hypothetical protein
MSFRENPAQFDYTRDSFDSACVTGNYMVGPANHNHHSRPGISGVFAPSTFSANSRVLESVSESDDEQPISPDQDNDYVDHDELACGSDKTSPFDEACASLTVGQDVDHSADSDSPDTEADLGNLSMYDDLDDVVQHAIATARMNIDSRESATRFSDLYYASIKQDFIESSSGSAVNQLKDQEIGQCSRSSPGTEIASDGDEGRDMPPSQSCPPNAGSYSPRPRCPRGPSSFALRVQEKLLVAANAIDEGHWPLQVEELDFSGDEGEGLTQDGDASCGRSNLAYTESSPSGGSYFCARAGVENLRSFSLLGGRRSENFTSTPLEQDSGDGSAHCNAMLLTHCLASDGETNKQPCTSVGSRSDSTASLDSRFSVNPTSKPPSTARMSTVAMPRTGSVSSILVAAHTTPQANISISHGSRDRDTINNNSVTLDRLLLAPAAGASGCSVKDKIRALEERFNPEQPGAAK